METSEDTTKPNVSKTLLIRHLPAEMSKDEKEDMLKYFGAQSVRVLPCRGRLKNVAFATFRTENIAAKALVRLHQLQVLGHTLVVEFAKGQDSAIELKDPPVTKISDKTTTELKRPEPKQQDVPLLEENIAPSLGLKFQANPTLKYLYPPPSTAFLVNITHALICVPKFYVQVLHLMNKMNLPCPFGPVTARPPLYEVFAPAPPMFPPMPAENPPLPRHEGSSESEYESEDDEVKERIARVMGLVNQACKRPLRQKTSSKRKKPRIKDLLFAPKADSQSASVLQPSDVFEQPNPTGHKKIEFHISVSETKVEAAGPGVEPQREQREEEVEDPPSTQEAAEVVEGFGKLFPSAQPPETQEQESEDEDVPKDVISRKELDRGRLSKSEIKRMSVFKKYEAGEPTCRLYVKNIAKQVDEKDLKYIYGRYIDLSSEAERNMFDIVLMKEGRMKGQAFVGLPSETSAQRALRDTNGYVLYDKPLVVQFARSAKPKDNSDTKRGAKPR
ncbi:RNA-binding region-containing protein 3 [Eucyclogobius newberryi]|uniref:RNA-binding region-containing protein 3 n=1 Tax=Eucyclogobius newberryi TaxID=166745 RepID=UPI003B5B2FF3